MADMETSWESSECRGDVGVEGGCGMMSELEGESLPPRKRLLAGLWQNAWLASSSPLVSPGAGELLQGTGQEEEEEEVEGLDEEGGGNLIVGEEQEEEEFTLLCCGCGRSLHPECDNKQKLLADIDSSSYFCSDCLSTATQHKESMNGSSGSRSKVYSGGTAGVNCSTIETGMVSSGAELSSTFGFKKPRLSRERLKLEDADHAYPSQSERLVTVRKPSQGIPVPVSSEDAAAAAAVAKSAAAQAVKVAMAAKENAAAKASIAAKAAAAAKVALEAAADAARAVALIRAELRKKIANSQPGLFESSSKLQIFVARESLRERISERTEVEVEKTEDKQAGHRGGAAASLDGEELAQQLHRVTSSSPHSRSPPQREAPAIPDSASSGVSISSTDAAWPQNIQTSPTEIPSQPQPQQTRPRSVMHEDLKQLDTRIASHEVKKIVETHEGSSQQQDALEYLSLKLSFKPNELPASEEISSVIKAEAVGGVVAFSSREESFTTAADLPEELVEDSLTTAAENSAELPFDIIMAATAAGAAHFICDSHERRPDLLQEILEAAVLADSAMSLDEATDAYIPKDAFRAEYNEGSVQQEGHSAFSDLLAEAKEYESRTDPIVVDVMPSTIQTPIAAGNAGDGSAAVEMANASMAVEDFGAAEMVDDADMASKHSGVAEVVYADAEIAVKDSGASEVLCTSNADMVLKGSEPLVIHADDSDTGLGDS